MKNYRLEDILYWNPPTGIPNNKLKIYCDFEVGGAYEDYGFVAEYNNFIIASGKNPHDLFEKIQILKKNGFFIKEKINGLK